MATLHSITASQQAREDRAIYRAMRLLESRLRRPGEIMSSTSAVYQFLILNLAGYEHEVFSVLWLDSQHRLISAEHLFAGTLTQTSVYPREVVKRCLQLNAAAVIFAHNHPSGIAEPSEADKVLTRVLMQALALVDVPVLDHFIVAGNNVLSFAERGLLGMGEVRGEGPPPELPKKRGRKAATHQQKKEDCYSSPEEFKEFALCCVEGGRGFQALFSGKQEQKKYGEITMRLDDQSLKKVAETYALLESIVKAAKVIKARPRLCIVK